MPSYEGPLINNTKRNFTTRDSLGIEGIATSISADLCPVVNTVTPRPYYWAFITWCYYSFYKTHHYIKQKEVYEYIRKHNFFIALGNCLENGFSDGNFIGSNEISSIAYRNSKVFEYKENYIKGLSTMGYYPPGLDTMKLIISQNDDTGERYNEPRITPEGEKLAKAFDKIIGQTAYAKKYLNKTRVPKEVLIELGKKIKINLKGFKECREILKNNLFEKQRTERLAQCKDYILFVKQKYDIELDSRSVCREIFYDFFSPRAKRNKIDDDISSTAKGWEIVIGRQYFTMGLEVIWKYMLNQLYILMPKEEWFKTCIKRQKFSFKLSEDLSQLIKDCNLKSQDMEKLLNVERSQETDNSLENGLVIMLSVFNRFNNRTDFDDNIKFYLSDLMGNDSVSLESFAKFVNQYKDKPIKEFLIFIMNDLLISQHLKTAFNKMLENRDGYYLEEIDGKYLSCHDFDLDFQGIRMVQLYSVMKDLGVFLHEDQ